MATPQTLLSVRDVMAGQNMMRLGGGLRRRDRKNKDGLHKSFSTGGHRPGTGGLRHHWWQLTLLLSRGNDRCLFAAGFVLLTSPVWIHLWQQCTVGAFCLTVSLCKGTQMNLLWKIMYFSYIHFIDRNTQRLCQNSPLTSTLP